MSIGQHKLGQMFTQFRASVVNGMYGITGKKNYLLPETTPYNVNGITAQNLPLAPANPYRKRPVKIVYDKNEFHMFRLPSEKAFLLGGFDHEDIFGERKGINHSPHLRAQMNMDSNLVWSFLILSGVLLVFENKRTSNFTTLRENAEFSELGRFEESDFK